MKSFYLSPPEWPERDSLEQHVVLGGSEAKHLLKVLRARPGDRVRLFDGQGREGVFSLVDADKSLARFKPLSIDRAERPKTRVHLALGWSKALRRGWLLEKAVELEAAGVWFWQARRSQGKVPPEAKETWTGQLLAGAKQCGNPWLPELEVFPGGVEELIRASAGFSRRFFLWEDQDNPRMLGPRDIEPGQVLFVLGPEGGFSPDEAATLANAGVLPLSLGRRVLRWETAALLALGLCWWAGQQGE